jgi:hypothetical protein
VPICSSQKQGSSSGHWRQQHHQQQQQLVLRMAQKLSTCGFRSKKLRILPQSWLRRVLLHDVRCTYTAAASGVLSRRMSATPVFMTASAVLSAGHHQHPHMFSNESTL